MAVETLFRGRRLDIIYKVYLTLCPIGFSLCKHRGKLILILKDFSLKK